MVVYDNLMDFARTLASRAKRLAQRLVSAYPRSTYLAALGPGQPVVNDGLRPILLKNSKTHAPQFPASIDCSCHLPPWIAGGSIRTILVARTTRLRLPPRPKLNEAP